jgi:hypothetical protein
MLGDNEGDEGTTAIGLAGAIFGAVCWAMP